MPEILLALTVPYDATGEDVDNEVRLLNCDMEGFDWYLRRLPDGERFTGQERDLFVRAAGRAYAAGLFSEEMAQKELDEGSVQPDRVDMLRALARDADADAAALRRMAGLEETDG